MTVPTRIRRPPIRLRSAPPLDPPFTDEAVQFGIDPGGQLALDLTGGAARPGAGRGGAGQHLVLAALPPDALAGASPQARQAAHRFLAATVEIINGFRPVGHVRRLADPAHAQTICGQLAIAVDRARGLGRPTGVVRGTRGPRRDAPTTRNGPPVRAAGSPTRADGSPTRADGSPITGSGRQRATELLRVRQIRICEPTHGVVETAAVLGTGSRSWALAFRLERRASAWLSTAVQVL
ncbi:Rv3235 family protein [Solwaraspora sp. WMMB335]|uniref:Rv3235 family protein n=1 Tax=Solwaraspora sp. WMMB335 TaxID=3404118 RepID=UPI003B94DC0A